METIGMDTRQREQLAAEIEALDRAGEAVGQGAALRAEVRSRVADVEAVLGRHVSQTRQVLRKLLVGPLRCAPFAEEGRRGYRFVGSGSFDRLLPAHLSRGYKVTPGASAVGAKELLSFVLHGEAVA